MAPTVWIEIGVIVIYGASFDADCHNHHFMQLIWSLENEECKLNGTILTGPTIIESQVPHQLDMSQGWVLLVEPKSKLGEALSQQLQKQSIKTFDMPNFSDQRPAQQERAGSYLTPLFNRLALPIECLSANRNSIQDVRINQLITELDSCLDGDCIKPTSWRAAEVADQLALSESRFLHLFREELGIAWRPYLLWRRLICAIQAVIGGVPATQAAHMAGFSDSAHLSRTFRKFFGMSLRQAHSLFKT